jgi:dipeptidyl aminopeptidase/acylaminoacyl peptidase
MATRRFSVAEVRLIPLEVLLGNPERAKAQISPDGKRLSYVAPLDGVLNVFVYEVGTGNERPVTRDVGRGIQGYLWAQDNRHLMYARDKDGSESHKRVSEDRDFLWSRSPLSRVDDIAIPILVAQGENDPRVEARRIRADRRGHRGTWD